MDSVGIWASIISKGKFPRNLQIYQNSVLSIFMRTGLLAEFHQNWEHCKTLGTCNVRPCYWMFCTNNLKKCPLRLSIYLNSQKHHLSFRDVGNNHLVGTIRELIRYEGSFPALRNLWVNNFSICCFLHWFICKSSLIPWQICLSLWYSGIWMTTSWLEVFLHSLQTWQIWKFCEY